MKLKKLEIHNIASIEDAIINFEAKPLADSNVILITGETGAGKSTILDAICLTLYATTPRMNNSEMDGKWQENNTDEMDITDTQQLMRKNTTDAYARLSFLGSDGNAYLAEWHVKRKTKNLDRTWSLLNLTHPEASPQAGNGKGSRKDNEIKEAIQEAVGLTFDQFCRTTMLAQGEFTRFLKSGNKEKAAILEKITNTEHYAEIGKKVYELTHHKYEEEMKKVDPEKKEQAMKPEQRSALEESLKTIGEQLVSLNIQLDTEQKKVNWLISEKTLRDNQTKAEDDLKQAKEAMETNVYKGMQQNVQDWDRTADARMWLTAIHDAKRTMANANQTIQQLLSQYITLLNGQEFMRQEMSSITGQIKKIDNEIQAEGSQQTSVNELNKQKEEVLALIGNIHVAQSEVKAFVDKKTAREEELRKLNERAQEITEKNKQLEELKPKVEDAKKLYDSLEKEYERLNLAVDTLAEKLRANLLVNHKCPICGQAVKSLDTIPHEQQLQAIVADAKKNRDDAKNVFDDLNGQHNKCTIWLSQNVPTYQKEVEALKNDQSLNKALKDALHSLGKCHITQLDDHTNEALEQANRKAGIQKKELEEKIKRAMDRENLQRTLELKENNAEAIKTSLKQLLENLPEWKSCSPQRAEELPNMLAKMQSLSNSVTTTLTTKETATINHQTNRSHLNDFLKEHTDITEPRLEQLLQLKDQIVKQRQSVEIKKNALANAQGALKTVNGQLEDHQKTKPTISEGETIESLQDIVNSLKNQIAPLGKESGAIEQQLKDDDERIKALSVLKTDYEKRKAVFERWNKLDKLIGDAKGDKFRLIAQSYILTNLVNAANVHMRTLTDRYTLHAVPGQDLIILVEDAYQGGVKRPASTISGGESFLVSLALALALSEIGQSLKVETLFIDEGFGTLSGEPLIKAIDTLESLHDSNNRQVCAISHREEVKEKIPVQIQVTQQGNISASKVEVVVIDS